MVFIDKEELHVSAYSGHLQVLIFFAKKSLYNMFKYKLFSRKLSELEDGRYRPKHVVLPCQ